MATQFVKWWKTKFHPGGCSYKTMTVLGSSLGEGRPSSDTEDLVRDDASSSSYNHGAHINPCCLISPSCSENSQDDESHHPQVDHPDGDHVEEEEVETKFEDFECDVQVEQGSESGEEKKEFSFTFYDLDGSGYGKITKDDIAGLVRSIYGAVNDSINVPCGGKKTIKVKLTVTPERSAGNSNSDSCNDQNAIDNLVNNNINLASPITKDRDMGNGVGSFLKGSKVRNNVSVTIQENLRTPKRGRSFRERLCRFDKPKFNSFRIPNHTNNPMNNTPNDQCHGGTGCQNELRVGEMASPLRSRKKWREKVCLSSSFNKPDLIDLIQANMEKNNVSEPHLKHSHPHHQRCNHNHTHTPTTNNDNQLPFDPLLSRINCPTLLLRTENFWKQKLSSDVPQSMCNNCGVHSHQHHHPVSIGNNNHNCSHKSSHHHHHHACKKHGHHRSRSHDLSHHDHHSHHHPHTQQHHHSPRYHSHSRDPPLPVVTVTGPTPPPPQVQVQNTLNTCCEGHHHEDEVVEASSPRNKNTNVTNHQLKHKNREVQHALAMANVINWLQRDNINSVDHGLRVSSPKRKTCNPHDDNGNGPPKQHHHHHHHQHVHHHYHHYAKETPIIV